MDNLIDREACFEIAHTINDIRRQRGFHKKHDGKVIDARGIFEARNIVINSQRVAEKILENEQRFYSNLQKKLDEGEWRID